MMDMKAVYEAKGLTQEQIDNIEECFARADAAQREFETWSQEDIDRAIKSVAQQIIQKSFDFFYIFFFQYGKTLFVHRNLPIRLTYYRATDKKSNHHTYYKRKNYK